MRLGVLVTLFFVTLAVWFPTVTLSSEVGEDLTVSFLDIGQGDSIHIETPDGYEMLIDGGPSASVLSELAKGRDFFDKEIDVVVATHPDTDHIAGLVDVLERYQVGTIVESQVEHDASAARAFARAAEAKGAKTIYAEAGQIIQLGASTTVRILSPHGDTTNWESNNASVVVQIKYGDTEFMLTGDAPSSIEEYLVSIYGDSLESDVLKLGHHGSKTSSSEKFLKAVQPTYAVVSAGKDNRYGHPTKEVIKRAGGAGAQIVSTIEEGTIVFKSDGKKVWIEE